MFLIRVDLSLNKCFTWMLIVALSWKAKLCLINWVSTLQSIRISLCLIKGCLPTTLLNRKPNLEALASYEKESNRKLFFNDTVQCTSLAHKVSNISFSTQISLLHDRSHSNFRVFSSLFSVQVQKIMNSSVVESIAEILSVSENTWNKHNFLPSSERALSGISVTIYFQVCCFCLPCLLSWCRRIAHGQKQYLDTK